MSWIKAQPRSEILDSRVSSDGALIHSRHLSRVLGAPDDLWVRCTPASFPDGRKRTVVEAHGSLRIGLDDFGANQRRIQALWHHLESLPQDTKASVTG